jgi:hypothetical protein
MRLLAGAFTYTYWIYMLWKFQAIYIKLSHNKTWRLRRSMECWISILAWTFGTTRMALSLLHTGCTLPAIISNLIISISSWVDPRDTECRQKDGSYRELNPEPPILSHCASTNCTTAHPTHHKFWVICMYFSFWNFASLRWYFRALAVISMVYFYVKVKGALTLFHQQWTLVHG